MSIQDSIVFSKSNTYNSIRYIPSEYSTILRKMLRGESKAVTYSNLNKRLSVVVFNQHNSFLDYLSSLVHEAEHVKQAMLYTYYIEDAGEPPAYTIGYLVMKMWRGFIAAIHQS